MADITDPESEARPAVEIKIVSISLSFGSVVRVF